MRLTKKRLKKIILEEYQKVIEEYGQYHSGRPGTYGQRVVDARRSNALPPKESNWYGFAKRMDIGVLDLDEVAHELGMNDFAQLDASISPRSMSDAEADELASIMYSINGADEIAVFDAMSAPYGG